MRTRPILPLCGAVLIGLATALTSAAGPALAAPEDAPTCAAHAAAFDKVLKDIDEHNAKPNVFTPSQRAEFDAYNAAAAELNTRMTTVRNKRAACESAVQSLGGAPVAMPEGFTAVSTAAKNSGSPLPQSAVDTFVSEFTELAGPEDWNDQSLQGKKRPESGAKDIAMTSGNITEYSDGTPAVSATEIVPVAEVIALPRFFELTPVNQWALLMSRTNHQWMSNQAALGFASPSVAAIVRLDDQWKRLQLSLAKTTKETLTAAVETLIQSQDLPS
ncbi:hypothetical protein [Mycolicibacterium brumae]|uniref:Uncharacterized protein n=1 Tax=Mycolicibacterium brumae TaxID=85968 RepID=A0A2G5P4B4_9MYCO|nr:hypothetical protein [Mycolicibacterium brumae]MCV7194850.1 hypothetical protein [Mycolicibacterium brumae]PIB73238.1 hypothetical protein CQY22_017545 [Mycolicibacterium brumae]RWA17891.1 hypothetical protein MBRU_18375 [Mycolicibacterium brumae DSM 44177]UWW09302.1 hypothetical protein L2Z93_002398 [Mycolicibacterium brumae]